MTFKSGDRVICTHSHKTGIAVLTKGKRTLVRFDDGQDVLMFTNNLELEQLAFEFEQKSTY